MLEKKRLTSAPTADIIVICVTSEGGRHATHARPLRSPRGRTEPGRNPAQLLPVVSGEGAARAVSQFFAHRGFYRQPLAGAGRLPPGQGKVFGRRLPRPGHDL